MRFRRVTGAGIVLTLLLASASCQVTPAGGAPTPSPGATAPASRGSDATRHATSSALRDWMAQRRYDALEAAGGRGTLHCVQTQRLGGPGPARVLCVDWAR